MKPGFVFVGAAVYRDEFILNCSLPKIDDDNCSLETLLQISKDFQHKVSSSTDNLIKIYKRLKILYDLEKWKKKSYPLALEYYPNKYLREIENSALFYSKLGEDTSNGYFLLEKGYDRDIYVYGIPSYSELEKFWNSRKFLREKEFELDKSFIENLDILERIQETWEKEENYWIEKLAPSEKDLKPYI